MENLPYKDLVREQAPGAAVGKWQDCPLTRAVCRLDPSYGNPKTAGVATASAMRVLGWKRADVERFVEVWDASRDVDYALQQAEENNSYITCCTGRSVRARALAACAS